MDELTIDNKTYISSKKAAEITGYAKDYIGQLCREGHVEARMVGRSWYVLESSIRAHRFGAEAISPASVPEEKPVEATSTWEQPTYSVEPVPSMPVPTRPQPEQPVAEPVMTSETLTDMQSAWKEWFAQKQDTFIETPEIIDAREEEAEMPVEVPVEVQEEAVSIHPIHDEAPAYEEIEEEAEPVMIHHVAEEPAYEAPVRVEEVEDVILTKQERKRAMAARNRSRRKTVIGPVIVRALLIVIMFVAVCITAIGTGYATRFMGSGGMFAPIYDYLGGTSTFSK